MCPTPFILPLSLCCAALALVTGCEDRADDEAAGPGAPPIRIITTVYPLADIARQVGGNRVTVEWLRESGQGPEALEPDSARRGRLRSADLVITSGTAHGWTLEGSDSVYTTQRVIRLDSLPSAKGLPGGSYLWLHPEIARELADALRARLSALDPKRETFFRNNAIEFIADVDRAIEENREATSHLGGGTFVSVDPGFAPLAAWAGMASIRVADTPLRAMADDVTRRLRDALPTGTDKSPRVFFAGQDTPPAVLRELESRANAKAIMLDALGTSAPSGRTAYGQILRYNLQQLTAAAPPATQPATK
jgi:ABC-type Zn uptake system ZnuABC Zn-binding protein ZnuA